MNRQGIAAACLQDELDSEAVNIVFGSHRLFQAYENLPPFPSNCVIFNLEPLYAEAKDEWYRRYLQLLSTAHVIDYAPRNTR